MVKQKEDEEVSPRFIYAVIRMDWVAAGFCVVVISLKTLFALAESSNEPWEEQLRSIVGGPLVFPLLIAFVMLMLNLRAMYSVPEKGNLRNLQWQTKQLEEKKKIATLKAEIKALETRQSESEYE